MPINCDVLLASIDQDLLKLPDRLSLESKITEEPGDCGLPHFKGIRLIFKGQEATLYKQTNSRGNVRLRLPVFFIQLSNAATGRVRQMNDHLITLPAFFILGRLGGGMAGAAWFLRKKGKEDQNQVSLSVCFLFGGKYGVGDYQ